MSNLVREKLAINFSRNAFHRLRLPIKIRLRGRRDSLSNKHKYKKSEIARNTVHISLALDAP